MFLLKKLSGDSKEETGSTNAVSPALSTAPLSPGKTAKKKKCKGKCALSGDAVCSNGVAEFSPSPPIQENE